MKTRLTKMEYEDMLEEYEEVEIECDSDCDDDIIEIEVYETDSDASSYYEEEVISDLPAVIEEAEEDEEESESEPESEYYDSSDEEQPEWATMKLKKTEKGETLRSSGNLAAPITFSPFKNTDFRNKLCNPDVLKNSEKGMLVRRGAYLSSPITKIPSNNSGKHHAMANSGNKLRRGDNVGNLLKEKLSLALPLTEANEAAPKTMKRKKVVTRRVRKSPVPTRRKVLS